jgi:putative PIN family toxin of toxin-antitoxin system
MLIVVDTNIFIGACMGNGAPSKVISSCLQGNNKALMGTTLFSEYESVINRNNIFKGCHLSKLEREELLDIFIATTEWTRIFYNWRPNLRDEGDNHLIELAVAGNAEIIITRNIRNFSKMELTFPDLKIITPEDFIKEYSK